MEATARLGDILVANRAVEREALESALHTACARIGETLRLRGLVAPRALADALAEQAALPRYDLMREAPDETLFTPRDMPLYERYRFVPVARDAKGFLLATALPSEALRQFGEGHLGAPVRFAISSERELRHYLASRAATTVTRRARLGLRRRYRHLTADKVMVPRQLRGLAALTLFIAALAFASASGTWSAILVICNCFYLASLLIKMEFYRQGSAAQRQQAFEEQKLTNAARALAPESLPVYTILVPMYRESPAVMRRLIDSLCALDYPRELLDIKLICEEDDAQTLDGLKALEPPSMMEILAVPPSSPRTKPKACNVALQQVRGEFVVIFDAEDQPARDQLRRAVAMFNMSGNRVACLQGSLNYYNRDERLLTQLFSIEYSSLFRLMLPGLERMGLPIPLGGTSNHLRTSVLQEVGGWDAFNVTEDADLGIRLAYFGYRTRSLPSLTLEEAPVTVRAWMKQRTRWIKGYIQTWLVYTRDTKTLKQRIGRHAYYGFQFFIGAPALTFLLAPILWSVFFVSVFGLLPGALSPGMQLLCGFTFVGGVLSQWLYARKVLEIEGWQYMRRAFFLYPFYWLLHSVAAGRALVQLITAPHYWEKTMHGITRMAK